MRVRYVPAALFLFSEALAQTPPTPDAILVAGASTSVNQATHVALDPESLALAPDGTLYLADQQHVWRVDPAGTLSPPLPAPGMRTRIPSSLLSPPMPEATCSSPSGSSTGSGS